MLWYPLLVDREKGDHMPEDCKQIILRRAQDGTLIEFTELVKLHLDEDDFQAYVEDVEKILEELARSLTN
jgi:hypothetical protein